MLMTLAGLAVVVLWRHERGSVMLLVVWAVFPPVFTYVTFPLLHSFLPRYLLFTLPAWVLLAAALVGVVARRIQPTSPRVFAAVAAVLLLAMAVVGLPGQVDARHNPVDHEPDFHRAAAIIETHLAAADGIVFAGPRLRGRRALAYEHAIGVIGTPRDVLLRPGDAGRYRPRQCQHPETCLAGVQRIWMLYTGGTFHGTYVGLGRSTIRVLKRDFTQVKVARGQQFTILRLDRRASG
jgi:mannosyltransferase